MQFDVRAHKIRANILSNIVFLADLAGEHLLCKGNVRGAPKVSAKCRMNLITA